MSLLNDALRKKKSEQAPQAPLDARSMSGALLLRRKKKVYRTAATGAVGLLAMGLLAWWLWSPGGSITMVAAEHPADERRNTAAAVTDPTAEPLPEIATGDESAHATAGPRVADAPAEPSEPPGKAPPGATRAPNPPAPARPALESTRARTALPAAKPSPQVATPIVAKPDKHSSVAGEPAPRSQRAPVAVEGLYEKARAYHRHQRLPEAIGMYREVLKKAPGHFDAAFNLTSAYLQTEAFDQAYAIAADLLLRAPGDARVLLNLAIAQIGRGFPREALDLLDRAVGLPQPPLYEIYFHKGVAYRQIEETDQALSWYRKAEAITADNPDLLFNLAVALDVKGRYGPAAAYYQRYLQSAVDLDGALRGKIARRIRDLRADLSAHPDQDEGQR